jgi:periplasmic protein TonB
MKEYRNILVGFVFLLINMHNLMAQIEPVSEMPPAKITDTTIFMVMDTMPEFFGFNGTDTRERIDNFIKSNLKWPSDVDCEGKIFIQVVVEKDGTLTNFKILRDIQICPGYTEEALRVIKLIPKWQPGIRNGKPVRVYFIIPVKFIITN